MGVRNRKLGPVSKVTRRGRPRWVIDFFWLDKSGRRERYRHDAKIQTRDGALLEARSLQERAFRTGSLAERTAAPTFRAFVEGTFRPLSLPGYKPSTRVRYEALLGQGLLAWFGSLHHDAITPEAIHGYAAELAGRGVNAKGPLVFLRTIFGAAVKFEVIDVAPKVPRLWRESRKLPESPPTADVWKLIDGARGWLRTAIAVAAFAGLRSGEVRGLEVRDIDLALGRIYVRRALSEDEVTTPKSGNDRVIAIAPQLRPILEEAVRSKLPKARLIVSGRGATPRRQHILARLKALELRLGVPEWTFHQFRHHFCTELVRSGAHVEVVRRLSGHASLDVLQRYVHERSGDAELAVGCFSRGSG